MKTGPLLLRLALALGAVSLMSCHRPNLHEALRAATFQTPQPWPMLLAAYQPWFGGKSHIDVGYSSGDPVTLQKQIMQAKNLGISGFVVNWYGPRREFEDRNYGLMQDLAAKNNFQIAIQYDEAVDSPGAATEAVIVDLHYAYDRYIGPQAALSRDAYLRYDGRPL